MTLCVVWKVGCRVFHASDSRISNGSKYSDYGIKVIPVPVTIYDPAEEGKSAEIAFQATYGMCFAGSFIGAYVVREFLVIALQKLQYIPTFSELSFIQIARIVNKFYEHIFEKLSGELDYDHSVDFFLSGYCPKEQKIKTAKFYVDYGEDLDKQNPKFSVIDDGDFIEYIGSGEDKYKDELKCCAEKTPFVQPLEALKQLINSRMVPSVGGNIQYGNFDGGRDFSVFGVVDTNNGLVDEIKYCYAGVDMNGKEFESDGIDYFIMGSYIDPFKRLQS